MTLQVVVNVCKQPANVRALPCAPAGTELPMPVPAEGKSAHAANEAWWLRSCMTQDGRASREIVALSEYLAQLRRSTALTTWA